MNKNIRNRGQRWWCDWRSYRVGFSL